MRFITQTLCCLSVMAISHLASAADVDLWPYEPLYVWVPVESASPEALNFEAKIAQPSGETLVLRLTPVHAFGLVPNENRALIAIFDLEDLGRDLFAAPGRYQVTIGSKPEKTVGVQVKKLAAAEKGVADQLSKNLILRLFHFDQTFGEDETLAPIFEKVVEKAPESPFAPYARVYLTVHRYRSATHMDREKILGRPKPDFSKPAQQLIDDLAERLQTSSWPLRGLILVHLGKAQGVLGNTSAAVNTFKDLKQEMPINPWSRLVDRAIEMGEKQK